MLCDLDKVYILSDMIREGFHFCLDPSRSRSVPMSIIFSEIDVQQDNTQPSSWKVFFVSQYTQNSIPWESKPQTPKNLNFQSLEILASSLLCPASLGHEMQSPACES